MAKVAEIRAKSAVQTERSVGTGPAAPVDRRLGAVARFGRHAMIILIVALCVRVAAAVVWDARQDPASMRAGVPDKVFPDSISYWHLGQCIARGDPYQYGPDQQIFRAPAYPMLLAGLFRVAGPDCPVIWARYLGALFGAVTVAGVIWIGRTLFDDRSALITGLLVAVYPGAIGQSVFILGEALAVPLMVAHLGCWIAAWRSSIGWRRTLWTIAGGVAAGLATLARPEWLLFTPFALGLALVFYRDWRRQLAIGVVMLAAISVTMLPWWVRNYAVAGRWVPTTLQVGASLYDGLGPQATGASDMRFVDSFSEAVSKEKDVPEWVPFEVRLDRRFRDAAIDWARAHPREALRLAGTKFLRIWSICPHAAAFQSRLIYLVMAVGYLPLLILIVVGAVRWGWHWPHVLCVLPAIYATGLHVIFVGSIRYRQPAMVMAAVLAGAAVSSWFGPTDGKAEPRIREEQGISL